MVYREKALFIPKESSAGDGFLDSSAPGEVGKGILLAVTDTFQLLPALLFLLPTHKAGALWQTEGSSSFAVCSWFYLSWQ